MNRPVALKVLPPDRISDPERKRRFVKEARAASALNHPNIVTIYDIGQAEGVDFIAMEYMAGKTLDRQIPQKGMQIAKALDYAIPLADALVAAHAAGIIRRDLKPSNVMVSDSGLVKILDFGLAKLIERAQLNAEGGPPADSRETSFRTDEGMILGTAAYMSPEQAQGEKVDSRSDIFSRVGSNGGQQPELLDLAGFQAMHPSIAPAGDRVAFSHRTTNYDVWRYQLGGVPEPFLTSSLADYNPQYSPDGSSIAFSSDRSGDVIEIWAAAADGSRPVQLTKGPGRGQGSPPSIRIDDITSEKYR